MEYREFVKMMFQKHKGKPAKDIMKMASVEWKKQKGGASPKGKKSKGGVMSSSSTISDGGSLGFAGPVRALADFENRLHDLKIAQGRGIGQSVNKTSGGYSGGMYTAGGMTAGGMTAGKMRKSKAIAKKEKAGNFLDDLLGGVGQVLNVGTQMLPFLPHLI